jgi:hypothetical protein
MQYSGGPGVNMEIKFIVDPKRLTLGDRIALEEVETLTARNQRDILARHMVDETGEYIEFDTACKVLNGLDMEQLNDTALMFIQALEKLKAKLVPPVYSGA